MNRRLVAVLQVLALISAIMVLVLIFPRALAFVELAAKELRYLWWLIFLVAIAVWLIWGIGRKKG